MGSPPHTRGIHYYFTPTGASFGITPAYAGNTCLCASARSPLWDHPRIRGEYEGESTIYPLTGGSPPHTRGIPSVFIVDTPQYGITPAYAGNTPTGRSMPDPHRDHPRIRGEYLVSRLDQLVQWGSPPHTRGILVICVVCPETVGITPAYAGNTDQLRCIHGDGRDHPRIRGEYKVRNPCRFCYVGSPPHTRGIPSNTPKGYESGGITPAYAGNTDSSLFSLYLVWDHPRIRGEYRSRIPKISDTEGSPPHTRGIPRIARRDRDILGITPAYAGNT